ncbi:MAG: hypothetical protein ACYCOU_22665 [Sulfobacillus sp.]
MTGSNGYRITARALAFVEHGPGLSGVFHVLRVVVIPEHVIECTPDRFPKARWARTASPPDYSSWAIGLGAQS